MKATEAMMDAVEATRERAQRLEALLDKYSPGDELSDEDAMEVYSLTDDVFLRARATWFHTEVSTREAWRK